MCPHDNTSTNVINTSMELWKNGVGEWIDQRGEVVVCDDCGKMFNQEKGVWE